MKPRRTLAWRCAFAVAFYLAVESASAGQTSCPPQWTAGLFAVPGVQGEVHALAGFDDGSGSALYAAGAFTVAGGQAAGGIARFTGAVWQNLGSGVQGGYALVKSLIVHDDGTGPALYVGGSFSTAGGVGTANIARWNGTTFTALGGGIGFAGSDEVAALAVFDDGSGPKLHAGGMFATAGGVPAANIARWDGAAWSAVGTGLTGTSSSFVPPTAVAALAVHDAGGGPALYAGGSFATAGGSPASNIARWDGSVWAPLGSGVSGSTNGVSVGALAVFDAGPGPALYAAGGFSVAGGQVADRIARWDGSAWSALGNGVNHAVFALAVHDSGAGPGLLAAGFIGSPAGAQIARWNGSSWGYLPGAFVGPNAVWSIRALKVVDAGGGPALFAGGLFTTAGSAQAFSVARYGAGPWMGLGSGGVDAQVYRLEVFDDGAGPALYAGGAFSAAGAVQAAGVGRWNGSGWSALGSGLGAFGGPQVYAMTVFDDGTGAALHVGGYFFYAGGQIVNHVARWSGTSWSPLGSGFLAGGVPTALAVHDDGSGPALFAGGNFASAGGVAANRVAKWNGTAWSPVGGGLGGSASPTSVGALHVHDDGTGPRLYAGGNFTTAGGLPAGGVASWDGMNWIPTGGGVSLGPAPGSVSALASFDDGSGWALYAGGWFTSAGGAPASNVARWNGWTWTPVGGAMSAGAYSPAVATLAVFDDGTGPALYAGGTFVSAGGVTVNHIMRWNGVSWSALGAGMNWFVYALASFDDGGGPALYSGGAFTAAGGAPSLRMARWTSWLPALRLSQPHGPGSGAVAAVTGLLPGHEYYNIFSTEPCVAGPGPYLGLCSSQPQLLIQQLLLPVGSTPFHWTAVSRSVEFGPYTLPPGLVVEGVCFDITGGILGCVSPVRGLAIQ